MASQGRNDPCLCGSGRKYKHCCLRTEIQEESPSGREVGHGAAETALSWLVKHHRRAVRAAIDEDFLGLLPQDARDRLASLPDELHEMVLINANEWLLAQAQLTLRDGRRVRASELILGPGGPLLLSDQRAYLETLAVRPMSLYEVTESRPNHGLVLKNLLEARDPEVWVEERSGSQGLVQWDVIGTRLIFVDDRWQLSGGVYPFNREQGVRVKQALFELLNDPTLEGAQWHSRPENDGVANIVIGYWLSLLARPRQMPTIIDGETREPVLLVTDHYEVRDWDHLTATLAAQPDVEGDREAGWIRFVEVDGKRRRQIVGITVSKKPNRVEAFASTLRRADEGKSWLQEIAGESLHHLTREMTDPRSVSAREERSRRSDPVQTIELPPEAAQEMYEHIYRNWADEPIPALNNKTPRAAMRSRAGREQVVELLKQYESSELRRARQQGQQPVDFEFLWKKVGLDRRALT